MITLIFPGYTVKNKAWAEEVSKNLKIDGQIRPVFWDHWEDETQKFDPKEKATLAARHSKGDKVNIIAKSIGTLVASHVLREIPDQVEKIILCGIPLGDLNDQELKLISEMPTDNLIVFQNDKDPHGSSKKVKALFPHFKIIEKESDNHDYPYYEDFQNFLL